MQPNLMSVTPQSMWPAVKAMLHSVYDQPDRPAVHAQFRLLDYVDGKLPQVQQRATQPRDPPPHRPVGISPRDAITRLIGAVLAEQTDEEAEGRRYLGLSPVQRRVPGVGFRSAPSGGSGAAASIPTVTPCRCPQDAVHLRGGAGRVLPIQDRRQLHVGGAQRVGSMTRSGWRGARSRVAVSARGVHKRAEGISSGGIPRPENGGYIDPGCHPNRSRSPRTSRCARGPRYRGPATTRLRRQPGIECRTEQLITGPSCCCPFPGLLVLTERHRERG